MADISRPTVPVVAIQVELDAIREPLSLTRTQVFVNSELAGTVETGDWTSDGYFRARDKNGTLFITKATRGLAANEIVALFLAGMS